MSDYKYLKENDLSRCIYFAEMAYQLKRIADCMEQEQNCVYDEGEDETN